MWFLGPELVEQLNPSLLQALPRHQWMEVSGDIQAKCEPEDWSRREAFQYGGRRVTLEQAKCGPQDVSERCICRSTAVRRTASDNSRRHRRLSFEQLPQTPRERGLPDTGLSD